MALLPLFSCANGLASAWLVTDDATGAIVGIRVENNHPRATVTIEATNTRPPRRSGSVTLEPGGFREIALPRGIARQLDPTVGPLYPDLVATCSGPATPG